MAPFEIKVNVQVDLSDSVKAFILQVMGGNVAVQPSPTTTTTAKAPAATTTTTAKAPAATTTTTAKASEGSSEYTAAEVRKIMAPRLNEHRAAIKAELSALGCESVSTMDAALYDDFVAFLETLSAAE